jgi:hypothetical protein
MLDDSDNKSHMSELTEDRTQKQFDAIHYLREQQQHTHGDGPRLGRYSSPRSGPTPPPAYIVGGNNNTGDRYQQQLLHNFQKPEQAKLDTIHRSSSTAVTTPSRTQPTVPRPSPRERDTPPHQVMVDHQSYQEGSSRSLGGGASGRLSVAQRARLQAERGSTPVKVRLDKANQDNNDHSDDANKNVGPPPTAQNSSTGRMVERRHSNSSQSQSRSNNFFSNIGRKLEAAIDKSVFSVDMHDTSDDDNSNSGDDLSSQNSPGSPSADDRHHNEVNQSDRNPANSSDDEKDNKQQKSNRGGPALLTQETLDGHNQHHPPSRVGSEGLVGAKTTVSSPSFGTPKRKDYAASTAGSSVISGGEEKKLPTPDRIKVSCGWTALCGGCRRPD